MLPVLYALDLKEILWISFWTFYCVLLAYLILTLLIPLVLSILIVKPEYLLEQPLYFFFQNSVNCPYVFAFQCQLL